MKSSILFILSTLSIASLAQESREASPADVAFHNKVRAAFKQALPPTFLEWTVQLPDNLNDMIKGELIYSCEGSTCWRTEETKATYDGRKVRDARFNEHQKDVHSLKPGEPGYIEKLEALLAKFENDTHLSVTLRINQEDVVDILNCAASGLETITAPPGWDHYYVAKDVLSCYTINGDDEDKTPDTSIFTLGPAGTYAQTSDEKIFRGNLHFPLDKTHMKLYKATNVVLIIKGSHVKALEFVKMMNIKGLQEIMK